MYRVLILLLFATVCGLVIAYTLNAPTNYLSWNWKIELHQDRFNDMSRHLERQFETIRRERTEPAAWLDACGLIRSWGYLCQEHHVLTDDGFILRVQRIVNTDQRQTTMGDKKSDRSDIINVSLNVSDNIPLRQNVKTEKGLHDANGMNGAPVFLQHGLLACSTNWIENLRNQSLGYILADAGYDVWLGNMRGNTYGRSHISFNPSQKEFWSWTWDEMARYDITAMVNYTLNFTKKPKLFYVGHSQGTLISFAQQSQDDKFKNNIELFFALGPVATVGSMKSPIRYLVDIAPEIETALSLLGQYEFLPSNALIKLLGATLCKDAKTRIFCSEVIFVICGFDPAQLNATRLPVYIGHSPAGTSVQNIKHFIQMVKSGLPQMFNFGSEEENRKHYGQDVPPIYDISKATVPTVLFSGQKDLLADEADVEWLVEKLPNVLLHKEIPDWDHMDFVWGMDAATLVYNDILSMIDDRCQSLDWC